MTTIDTARPRTTIWTRETIAIAVAKQDGTRRKRAPRVEAWRLEGSPFAVHPRYVVDGEPSTCWTITHVGIGYAVTVNGRDETAAREAAEALATVRVDWSTFEAMTMRATFLALPSRVQTRIKGIVRRAS